MGVCKEWMLFADEQGLRPNPRQMKPQDSLGMGARSVWKLAPKDGPMNHTSRQSLPCTVPSHT